MTNALLLVPIFTLLLGGLMGYCLGRYQNKVMNELRTLRAGQAKAVPKPTVSMGVYEQAVSTAANVPTDTAVGVVEIKTPELVEFETRQAIEKEALGR